MQRPSWTKLALISGLFFGIQTLVTESATAQVTVPRMLSATTDRSATLEEQLTNRLRATSEEQRAYLRFVVLKVKEGKLDLRLVVAVERYALRRRPDFPFPFFERAMKVQAAKYGVVMPPVKTFASTAAIAR
ncbi:secreted protein [Rhodopirellula maiorica SM1]|uniref:Secreted protein n=1 Tax=Rhodopirellula maiorica SM1 TaxID=1265738 RepID=M5RSV6_9BACT|nr:secreted protein [Rhodopirellula maiorica]EMI22423.1 secreted protein [Rhodopirellula maiorica SM1]